MPMPDPSPILPTFLAHRDEPCPSCAYNLRGCTSPNCPECGRELRLVLENARALSSATRRHIVLFCVLVLVWAADVALSQGFVAYRMLFSPMYRGLPRWYTFQTLLEIATALAIFFVMSRALRRFLRPPERTDAAHQRLLHIAAACAAAALLLEFVMLTGWMVMSLL